MTPAAPEPTLTRGHKKKARTRQALLDAALEVLASQGEGFNAAEIASRAGVSHGTFYNYFADKEQLVAALVPHIVGAFAARSAVEVDDPDPASRFAVISARALAQAAASPEIVRVALRLEAVQQALLADGPFTHLRQDLAEGHRAGRFPSAPDDATLDVVVGALLLAARRIVEGETGVGYRRDVVCRLLQALGMSAGESAAIADQAVSSTL